MYEILLSYKLFGGICVISVVLFLYFQHISSPYKLLRLWNYCVEPWRKSQNEDIRQLAANLQKPKNSRNVFTDNLKFQPYGLVPGLCPAVLFSEKAHPKFRKFDFISQMEKDIQGNYDAIRSELEHVVNDKDYKGIKFSDLDEVQHHSFGAVPTWKTLWIYFLGKYSGLKSEFPILSSIVERYKEHIGLLMFSVLLPGTEIPPHVGPMKGVLRYHFPFTIPRGDSMMTIDGFPFKWTAGNGVIFDDTYTHTSHNKTNSIRVMLFADVLRPLPSVIDTMNRWVHRSFQLTRSVKETQEMLAKEGIRLD